MDSTTGAAEVSVASAYFHPQFAGVHSPLPEVLHDHPFVPLQECDGFGHRFK